MNVFLLHPEDPLQRVPKDGAWDLIVDLGRAPKSFYDDWARRLGSPILSIFDLTCDVEDLRVWRDLLAPGMGRVVDRLGIDWWDVVSILLQPEMQNIRLAQRLAARIGTCESLTVSQPLPIADALRMQLGCPLRVASGLGNRLAQRWRRYGRAAINLNVRQLRQVVYDKYDARYAWRRQFSRPAQLSSQPAILVPSAYVNVTRCVFRYAELLSGHDFLLVLARETAAVSPVPRNVTSEVLAAFAPAQSAAEEIRELEHRWDRLLAFFRSQPEFELMSQVGLLEDGKRWLRWGVAIRDAWNAVFERRNIVACLSGDDSNPYTRIPLLLARQRKIPAVAFHHGALDAFMAFKRPAFSDYLVKGDMERDYLQNACGVDGAFLRVAAAGPPTSCAHWSDGAPWVVFFTEPYETDLWRAEAIYREVMPRLCQVARCAGKTVVVKLHPFETRRQRERLLRHVLSASDRKIVRVLAEPLSPHIFRNAWCAVTVESTTALECATAGIPTFLCGWLRHAYVGYAQQYARFGVARMLEAPADLLKIPELLPATIPAPGLTERLLQTISVSQLSKIVCGSEPGGLR